MSDEEGEGIEEGTELEGQMIIDAIRRSVDDGTVFSYWSLDRLLAAMYPVEEREQLQADITSDFGQRGRPVPRDARWHLVYTMIDGGHDGSWRISMKPDLVLPGYVVAVMCDQQRYVRAQQNIRDIIIIKKLGNQEARAGHA